MNRWSSLTASNQKLDWRIFLHSSENADMSNENRLNISLFKHKQYSKKYRMPRVLSRGCFMNCKTDFVGYSGKQPLKLEFQLSLPKDLTKCFLPRLFDCVPEELGKCRAAAKKAPKRQELLGSAKVLLREHGWNSSLPAWIFLTLVFTEGWRTGVFLSSACTNSRRTCSCVPGWLYFNAYTWTI